MLDEKFIEAIGGLGALSALLLVVLLLAGLLWAVLRWMKERETEQGEHIRVMMASYQNLNNANEAMIKRIEQAAKFDQEYADKLERSLREEREQRLAEATLLKKELGETKEALDASAVKLSAMATRIADLERAIAERDKTIADLEGKLASIQKQRDNLRRENTSMQSQITAMAIQISKLEDDREPTPPVPVKSAPRPRLVPKANGKDAEEKDVVALGDIKEVDDEEVA